MQKGPWSSGGLRGDGAAWRGERHASGRHCQWIAAHFHPQAKQQNQRVAARTKGPQRDMGEAEAGGAGPAAFLLWASMRLLVPAEALLCTPSPSSPSSRPAALRASESRLRGVDLDVDPVVGKSI